MKRFICIILCVLLICSLCACGSEAPTPSNNNESSNVSDIPQLENVPFILSQMEYTIYSNLYNNNDTSIVNQESTKNGVFAVMHDYQADRDRD